MTRKRRPGPRRCRQPRPARRPSSSAGRLRRTTSASRAIAYSGTARRSPRRQRSRISTPAVLRRRRTRTRCGRTTPPGTWGRLRRRARRRRAAATRQRRPSRRASRRRCRRGARSPSRGTRRPTTSASSGYDVYRNGSRDRRPDRDVVHRSARPWHVHVPGARARRGRQRQRAVRRPSPSRRSAALRASVYRVAVGCCPCATRRRRHTFGRSCSRRCSACPSRSRPCSSRPRSTT